jgi:hypothetical protein
MAAAHWDDRWWVADRIFPAAGRGPSGVWGDADPCLPTGLRHGALRGAQLFQLPGNGGACDVAIPNAVAQQAHTP